MILPQALEMAEVLFTNRMTLTEGRSLELSRPDFGDIVGQLAAHSLW
jgi:hypothetical protein